MKTTVKNKFLAITLCVIMVVATSGTAAWAAEVDTYYEPIDVSTTEPIETAAEPQLAGLTFDDVRQILSNSRDGARAPQEQEQSPEMNDLTLDILAHAAIEQFQDYPLEEILHILSGGGGIYQQVRRHYPGTGTVTELHPISDSELEYLAKLYTEDIQPFSAGDIRIGDLDGNNLIDMVDVALLRSYVMGAGFTLPGDVQARIAAGAGNILGRSNITIMEVALLRTHAAGQGHTLTPSVRTRLEGGQIPGPSAGPFTVEVLRESGRSHRDSIVVVILSDGFPAHSRSEFLSQANRAMNSMLNTQPFSFFQDWFTVYAIHSHHGSHDQRPANQRNPGFSYLHSINAAEILDRSVFHHPPTPLSFRTTYVRGLAGSIQGLGPNQNLSLNSSDVSMIHVISYSNIGPNDGDIGGIAVFPTVQWYYYGIHPSLGATIAVTSTLNNSEFSSPLWPNNTFWHAIFIHEFGHSFGSLADENSGVSAMANEQHANTSSRTPDQIVKWNHWFGHRNVTRPRPAILGNPAISIRRYPDNNGLGWAVPSELVNGRTTCLMGTNLGDTRNFCGVCSAELIRRLAFISGETFIGRSPIGSSNPAVGIPNTPTVTISTGTPRILDSAFHGNTSLHTINIPASVTSIGNYAFLGATGLRVINNHNRTPQQVNNTIFEGVDRSRVTVNIPSGTTSAYRQSGWSFFNLVERP